VATNGLFDPPNLSEERAFLHRAKARKSRYPRPIFLFPEKRNATKPGKNLFLSTVSGRNGFAPALLTKDLSYLVVKNPKAVWSFVVTR
jgi:hypothetical protein